MSSVVLIPLTAPVSASIGVDAVRVRDLVRRSVDQAGGPDPDPAEADLVAGSRQPVGSAEGGLDTRDEQRLVAAARVKGGGRPSDQNASSGKLSGNEMGCRRVGHGYP